MVIFWILAMSCLQFLWLVQEDAKEHIHVPLNIVLLLLLCDSRHLQVS